MLNYVVPPELLQPHVPRGVELDTWGGETFVSMVGFLFRQTRVLGWQIPWHTDFEEVNLRFYVRRLKDNEWRRGVVFLREIVPRRLISAVANYHYNEPYLARPMRHRVDLTDDALRGGSVVQYEWRHGGKWNALGAVTGSAPKPAAEGSVEQFITEHYWGYTAQRNGGCKEYRVDHPRWKVWPAHEPYFRCDIAASYGEKFTRALSSPPDSAFVADGSAVIVGFGSVL